MWHLDLPKGPKLHRYLEWPWKYNINDNTCRLVVWYMGTMGDIDLCRLNCM